MNTIVVEIFILVFPTMTNSTTVKILAIYSVATGLVSISPATQAHTRVQIPVISENTRIYNALVIEHGCDDPATGSTSTPVFGQSAVFPNLADSSITTKAVGSDPQIPGSPYAGNISDFLLSAGVSINKIQSRDVFTLEGEKSDSLGNVIGFWGGNGALPGVNYIGLNPFVAGPVLIQPKSCAASVTFVLGVVDVCKITTLSGFTTETVNMWTPAVGSNYDGTDATNDGFNSPATLTVTRNVATNPLPSSCGAGVDVTVTPSATQLNRDLPVLINGKQVWPLP